MSRNQIGNWLLSGQFALLLLLAGLAAPQVWQGTIPAPAFLLAGASLALAAWTLVHNRPGNFNFHPAPKVHGIMVTTGPYRWIRHPMYTAVLLGAAALALPSSRPLTSWATWAALALVLFLKARLEERWMLEQHPGYAAYLRGSKRFLPFLI